MDVAFGVFGTAGIALHSARRVYELVSGVRGAPEAVNNVSRDVKALASALEMLQTMLRAFHEPEQLKMVPMLQLPLDNCIEILHDIEIKIKPYIKTQAGKPNIWRVSYGHFARRIFLPYKILCLPTSNHSTYRLAFLISKFQSKRIFRHALLTLPISIPTMYQAVQIQEIISTQSDVASEN